MAKLLKGNDWVAQLKGKGVTVIDNTGTVPEDVSKPMPVRDVDRGPVKNGKVERTQVMPTANGSIVLPAQSEVDAALEASRQAREAAEVTVNPEHDLPNPGHVSFPGLITPPAPGQTPFKIEPSDPISFTDLAEMAQAPEIAEENLVVTEVTKVAEYTPEAGLVVNDGSMSWDDLVAGSTEQIDVPDFPPETPIVYVSLDVPEGVEVVFRLNGQELL